MRNWIAIYAALVLAIVGGVSALFEDQVGKFDWRATHIGCPSQTALGRYATSGKDFLIVASKRNALASINVNSGEIEWRQINEIDHPVPPQISQSSTAKRPYVATLVNGGEFLRVFDQATGVLKWQQKLNLQAVANAAVLAGDKAVFLVAGSTLRVYSIAKGTEKLSTTVSNSADFLGVAIGADGSAHVAAISGNTLSVSKFSYESGSLGEPVKLTLPSAPKKVTKVGRVLIVDNAAVDVTTSLKLVKFDAPVSDVIDLGLPATFAVAANPKLSVFELRAGSLQSLFNIDYTPVVAATIDTEDQSRQVLIAYYDVLRVAKLFDLKSKKLIASVKLEPLQQAPIDHVSLLVAGASAQILTVRKDCRVDLYEIQSTADPKAVLEWSRFEALAEISSVEMVDLPLSESQARIETEFSLKDSNILQTFSVRLFSQIEEFRRSVLDFIDRAILSFELVSTKHVSLSVVMKNFLGDDSALRRLNKPRPGSAAAFNDAVLERDYFNLRKVIVVTSLNGAVLGLHNDDGSVLWSLYLGDDAQPLKTQLGKARVPLFIQRTTAHYQFNGQATVAFGVKGSSQIRLLAFNPITGQQTDIVTRNGLKRIELLPFTNSEHLYPVLTIDSNDKIEVYPFLEPTYPTDGINVFSFDAEAGTVQGGKLDLASASIVPTWKSSLNFAKNEKFVFVSGKPVNQKTHSQGRVLGDRSVLYKYTNPNLVAALTYDSTESQLSVHLIDAVSGQIIHTARHTRVQAPFHAVHCENWLVYTYWNEKTRRTELGVIELYEGAEQTNANNFNSLTTTKTPLEVISKAYVFSQGVSAIQATDTVQGLSTRSLLIAMPFGGILEVSRRFADARRPIEMTPELREEMIVPYMPELPVATEELINYNQTVAHIHGIKTATSGLESTSLMLAYGLDLFYTRVTPSGTFDILKDDFDYVLISAVMILLVTSSFVVKRIWKQSSIKAAWA
uniref:ER membrane protein complex subunit 1 n=1 Tax=Panagrellus redivivus TaxID=6233 RepID=A0A7E4VNT4_PANRE